MNSLLNANPQHHPQSQPCIAKTLNGAQRQELALKVLSGTETVSDLSHSNQVSRKFLYQQEEKAKEAINQAFDDDKADESEVLFYLPVTKKWIRQLVLGLLFICHSSYRGVNELLRELFD